MMEELNRAVPNFSALPFQDLRLGVVCCAPSSLDSRWYRVSVVAATDVASVSGWGGGGGGKREGGKKDVVSEVVQHCK